MAQSQYEAEKQPTLPVSSRLQKSSLKDLVNRFNAAGDGPLPVPQTHQARSTSASQTPQLLPRSRYHKRPSDYTAQSSPSRDLQNKVQRERAADNFGRTERKVNSGASDAAFQVNGTLNSPKAGSPTMQKATNSPNFWSLLSSPIKQQPLFGEVVPGAQIGYGINPNRLRRGSEGSMHSPNPMFPPPRSQSNLDISPSSPTAWYLGAAYQGSKPNPPEHRRTRSDFTGAPNVPRASSLTSSAKPSPYIQDASSNTEQSWRGMSSKIPISASKQSPSPGSSPTAAGKNLTLKHPAPVITAPTTPQRSSPYLLRGHANFQNYGLQTPPTSSTSKRQVGSPSNLPNGNRSLKAYITAPAPARSPPLRSSRPRQPVSIASNSPSSPRPSDHLRVPPTWSTSGRGNDSAAVQKFKPRKQPEIGGLDFAARRERMMQALSQGSKEGGLSDRNRPTGRQRINGYRGEQEKENSPDGDHQLHAAPEFLNHPFTSDYKDRGAKHKLSLVIDDTSTSVSPGPSTSVTEIEDDSPTLGIPGSFPSTADDSFSSGPVQDPAVHDDLENAVAANGGKALNIDADRNENNAQSENGTGTILSQIAQIRARSPSTITDEQSAEWGDQESIHIMLGSTPVTPDASNLEPLNGLDDNQETNNAGEEALLHKSSPSFHDSELNLPIGDNASSVGHDDYPDSPANQNLNDLDGSQAALDSEGFVQAKGHLTLDGEAYDTINRVLEQYYHPNTVTPHMVHSFQQHVLTASPDLAKDRSWDSEKLAKFYLEELAKGRFSTDKFMRASWDHDYELGPFGERFKRKEVLIAQHAIDEERTDGTALIYSSALPTEYSANSPSESLEQPTNRHRHALDDRKDTSSLRLSSVDSGWSQETSAPSAGEHTQEYKPIPPPKDWKGLQKNVEHPIGEGRSEDNFRFSKNTRSQLVNFEDIGDGLGLRIDVGLGQDSPTLGQPPLPNHSPPPPPMSFGQGWPTPSAEYSDLSPTETRSMNSSPRSARNGKDQGVFSLPVHVPQIPPIPSRVSSVSSQRNNKWSPTSTKDSSQVAVSPTKALSPTPEKRRLAKRRLIIKELVDTEKTYRQDMSVVEDIYKATSTSPKVLRDDDRRVLFGNSDQVLEFSTGFCDRLKQAAASVYTVPRSSRWPKTRGSVSLPNGVNTEHGSPVAAEATDEARDRKTFIGQVFEHHVARMEQVYGNYLRNHEAANQRLLKIQTQENVRHWLDECKRNCNDLTEAWDLDSLLVKPTQRILKYPLLLKSLLEVTPENHPDHGALKNAVRELVDASHRINEAKKRADLVDQVVNRRRKESDVRAGIAKAFGRRTEKLRQQVGLSESVDDPVYKKIAQQFGGHFFQVQIVLKDVDMYITKTEEFVARCNGFIDAVEGLIEVGQSDQPEIESKWRKLARVIRELTAVALPQHRDAVQVKVCEPMNKVLKAYENSERIMQKRKKFRIDYARYRNIQERGDKPDKKTIDQADQFKALNDALKDELPRLFSATPRLISACLELFVDVQVQWNSTWRKKLGSALEDQQVSHKIADILSIFSMDFEYAEAQVISLGICNGSLLADASNFLSGTGTLMSDDSSFRRQRPSTLNSSKRTLSVASDLSPALPHAEASNGNSTSLAFSPFGESMPPLSLPNLPYNPYSFGRRRAGSINSSRGPATPSASSMSRATSNGLPVASYFALSRPSTATPAGRMYPEQAPLDGRLSIDAVPRQRPNSSSTYYTAQANGPSGGRVSGIFSSAMPMSDSPIRTRPVTPAGSPLEPQVLFLAASLYEFNIDRQRQEGGYPYLTYVIGEVFDVIGEKGELWLARNQDDNNKQVGWIWEKHFAKIIPDG